MMAPKNGSYIVQGEISLLLTAMKRSHRMGSRSYHDEDSDPLYRGFSQLKDVLNSVSDIEEVEPCVFLAPFLDVIRSEETTGPITGLALTSVNKFLSYSLVEVPNDGENGLMKGAASAAIEAIAEAVTHARFVGTEHGSDEVVLMKILHTLRTLLLVPAGVLLSNEAVCEIMQSCFRICFEVRLSELLRKTAENTLMDMVQLLFARLPQLKDDLKVLHLSKKLKMSKDSFERGKRKQRKGSNTGSGGKTQSNRATATTKLKSRSATSSAQSTSLECDSRNVAELSKSQKAAAEAAIDAVEHSISQLATTPVSSEGRDVVDIHRDFEQRDQEELESCVVPTRSQDLVAGDEKICVDLVNGKVSAANSCANLSECTEDHDEQSDSNSMVDNEYVNPHGVRFTSHCENDASIISTSCDTGGTKVFLSESTNTNNSQEDSATPDNGSETVTLSNIGNRSSDSSSINAATDKIASSGAASVVGLNSNSLSKVAYGLPCVLELLRFLVSLINPYDRTPPERGRANTDVMIHMGLSLLTVALESGADNIPTHRPLLTLVRADMCKNLLTLLHSDRLSIFASTLRVCFLLFESMRTHLKLQLETYLIRLAEVITADNPRVSFEHREIALESVVQLWRIPGLVTELYLNYDCDIYCSNLFKDITELLSKNAFTVSGLFTTHLLSLDALLTVIEAIEQHCTSRVLSATKNSQASLAAPTLSSVHSSCNSGSLSSIPEHTVANLSLPPISGYQVGLSIVNASSSTTDLNAEQQVAISVRSYRSRESPRGPHIRPNRQPVSARLPSEEELAAARRKKRLLQQGTEQFNQKPARGISFLQEQGLLHDPLDVQEVVTLLRENPRLDKRMIGEYVSAKKNSAVLEALCCSFNFEGQSIDEALRVFLEAFRLPGEAPLISHLITYFARVWHENNPGCTVDADAAYVLAYGIIMLNTDQHNVNAKKQNEPMKLEDFKRNLKGVNGGSDFASSMLDNIFFNIRTEEIVMPEEQSGQVRDNYIWKQLLRRGAPDQPGALFLHSLTGAYDHDLFTLIWGPTVAALSHVFDKTQDEAIIAKAIAGFRKCAMISAHYGLSDVFDNLIISLCKFTNLLSASEPLEGLAVAFGNNVKAQLAARTVFGLAYRHGDFLREGWKNILDCLLQLFKAKLLPDSLTMVEDFVHPDGRISLIREEPAAASRQETGVFSSIYSLFAVDANATRSHTAEEQEARQRALICIRDCGVEQVIKDSKFIRIDSLNELVKDLVLASRDNFLVHDAIGIYCDEDACVFYLELLLQVLAPNRDRLASLWSMVRSHFCHVLLTCQEAGWPVERHVVGLLRLAHQLLRGKADMRGPVMASLRLLVLMRSSILHAVCRHVVFGVSNLIHTHAANVHSADDWRVLLTLLEVCGAGALPPQHYKNQVASTLSPEEFADPQSTASSKCKITTTSSEEAVGVCTQSDTECVVSSDTEGACSEKVVSSRGYTSDSELYNASTERASPRHTASWVLVERSETAPESGVESLSSTTCLVKTQAHHSNLCSGVSSYVQPAVNQYSIALNEDLKQHDSRSLVKACETLNFIIRDAAHVTLYNFEACVHAVRVFAEASLNGDFARRGGVSTTTSTYKNSAANSTASTVKGNRNAPHNRREVGGGMQRSRTVPSSMRDITDSDEDISSGGLHVVGGGGIGPTSGGGSVHANLSDTYLAVSVQLLDMMHDLHTRAAGIFVEWADKADVEVSASLLWERAWCPLLQGCARLCCDVRRQVRKQALTVLTRALLAVDLQQRLNSLDWEACFNKVLFPLLTSLLETAKLVQPSGMEETLHRAATLLTKVFLQHLNPLVSLTTFTALWLTILDFMDRYMHAVTSSDLLSEAIPESLKNMLLVMDTAGILRNSSSASVQPLWDLTWHRIATFLPNLMRELFPEPAQAAVVNGDAQPVQAQPGEETVVIFVEEEFGVEQQTSSSSVTVPLCDAPTTRTPLLVAPAASFEIASNAASVTTVKPGVVQDL